MTDFNLTVKGLSPGPRQTASFAAREGLKIPKMGKIAERGIGQDVLRRIVQRHGTCEGKLELSSCKL